MATAISDFAEIKNILAKLENNIGIACQQISGEIISLLSLYYMVFVKLSLIYLKICHYLFFSVFKMLKCVSK